MIHALDYSACVAPRCGICIDVCPNDVLRLDSDGKPRIVYPSDCNNCMTCVALCPVEAIKITPNLPKKFDPNTRWRRVKDTFNIKA